MKTKPWIVFDLDDTLIPSRWLYEQGMKAISDILPNDLYLEARSLVKSRISSTSPSSHNRFLYFKAALEKLGPLKPKRLLEINTVYESARESALRSFWAQSTHQELLEKLSHKFNLAVITNEICRTQMLKLQIVDPTGDLFQVILTSEEVGVEKPNPLIFKELITRIGNPDPSFITIVGDSLQNDIQPGLSLGWKSIWTKEHLVDEEKSKTPPNGAIVIDYLKDLPYKL